MPNRAGLPLIVECCEDRVGESDAGRQPASRLTTLSRHPLVWIAGWRYTCFVRQLAKYKISMRINEAFKALADPTRRQILALLRRGEMTAGELAEHFDMAKPSV